MLYYEIKLKEQNPFNESKLTTIFVISDINKLFKDKNYEKQNSNGSKYSFWANVH